MPSFLGVCLSKQLRMLKPIVERSTIQDARFVQDKCGELGAKANANKVSFVDVPFKNFRSAWAIPKECTAPDRAVLYLHGGGYTAGHLEYAKGFGSVLAVNAGIRILCVAYRLAPEYAFPAALDDALEAYKYLLANGCPAENISLAGESAGGGLEFALAIKLRELSLPLPRNIVALSPWSDLAMTGESYTSNYESDPSLAKNSLEFYASLYAKGNLRNPLVSPLYGNLSGMPDSLIFAGADEILLDDSTQLAQKLLDSGCKCTLHVVEGMWHVFPLYAIPEGKQAIKEICEFLKE
ncbi:MAG: alpha/beta hydrolase [Oscillospiraceae bacterium]